MKNIEMPVSRARMSERIMNWLVLFIILILTSCTVFAGRGDKSGSAGAQELLIPIGARGIGLGGSSLASASGLEAIYWNPAGLAKLTPATAIMVSHMSYVADISVDYLALGIGVGGGATMAVTLKSLSFGDIAVTTEDQPDGTGEMTSPRFLTAGVTFSRQLSERISVGITSNYVYEKMGDVSASGFGFNAGVQYIGLGGVDGLGVGVAIKNIGPRMKYDGVGLERFVDVRDALSSNPRLKIEAASSELPSTIEIGLGYTTHVDQVGDVTIESMFQNNNYSDDEYKVGFETVIQQRVSLRAGYSFGTQSQGGESIFGFAGGLGVRTKVSGVDLVIDYAYRVVAYFSGNHVIQVQLGLN